MGETKVRDARKGEARVGVKVGGESRPINITEWGRDVKVGCGRESKVRG